MIYVMSDIHGKYDKYLKMLELIDFNSNDTLYILGDFVDRGKDGIKILLDVINRPNIISLIGNHDWLLYTLMSNYKRLAKKIGVEKVKSMFQLWFYDGGRPTYDGFIALTNDEKTKVLEYIDEMHYIIELEVSGRKYFLSHTVPAFDDVPLLDHLADDFIHGEPDYDKRYFEDMIIITGHTPTELIDKNSKGRIWYGNGHIAIDCSAGWEGALGCLCLDDMKEYYVE